MNLVFGHIILQKMIRVKRMKVMMKMGIVVRMRMGIVTCPMNE